MPTINKVLQPVAFLNEILDPAQVERQRVEDANDRAEGSRAFVLTVVGLQNTSRGESDADAFIWNIEPGDDRLDGIEQILGVERYIGDLPEWIKYELVEEGDPLLSEDS